jgi:IclR family pca regulon transcriptional regulator
MGRVLLSDLPPPQLREFLSTARIERNTEKSITDRNKLAAEITRVAQAGFAIVDEELEIGLRSLAVPIRDRSRRVVAAINVSTQSSRFTTAEMEREILPHLLAAARSIEDFFVVQ